MATKPPNRRAMTKATTPAEQPDEAVEGSVRAFQKAQNRMAETSKDLKAAAASAKKDGRMSANRSKEIERLLSTKG